jgi:hypothetical protein
MTDADQPPVQAIEKILRDSLARPARQELRPTLVARAGLALIATPTLLIAGAAGAWPFAVGAAAVSALLWTGLARRRLLIDEHGVSVRGMLGRRAFAWDEIRHYTYWAGRYGNVELVLRDHDGRWMLLDARYRDIRAATARIIAELHARYGERATFAPFSLEDEGLRHMRAGLLRWKDLEVVKLDRQEPQRMRVLKRGKALAWVSTLLSEVENSVLLLERLGERGVAIELPPAQLVTTRLREMLAARAALPRAQVVRRD